MMDKFKEISGQVDVQALMSNIRALWEQELGQTNSHQIAAAQLAARMLNVAGVTDVQTINLPADGKTVFQDLIMPLAWQAGVGRLTIKKSRVKFDDPLVADYARHPFHLVKGSVATPAGGVTARIINEEQLAQRNDVRGCMVMLNPLTLPRANILKTILDKGGLGFISDNLVGRYETPDALQWVTACTEGANWHVNPGDRPFVGFSLSPRMGDQIRQAVAAGEATALVESDGRREVGVLPVVTGLIPGRRSTELWLLAHLYEPLSSDNSSGVASCIEIARILNHMVNAGKLPQPEFSLRLVFASEFYGFTGFIEKMGGDMTDRALGAINLDAMPVTVNTDGMDVYFAPPGTPFFGNYLMEELLETCRNAILPRTINKIYMGAYSDDASFSDPTIGLPTLWVRGRSNKRVWHNSCQDMEYIDPKLLGNHVALLATWVGNVLTADPAQLPVFVKSALSFSKARLKLECDRLNQNARPDELRNKYNPPAALRHKLGIETRQLKDFNRIAPHPAIADAVQELDMQFNTLSAGGDVSEHVASLPADTGQDNKWFDYCAGIIPRRLGRGVPYDLAVLARKGRTAAPDAICRGGLMRRIYANMDGVKSLQRLIQEAAWEGEKMPDELQIKKHIASISLLTDYGYLATEFKRKITQTDIVNALKNVGVCPGDLLAVHSSLSAFGRIGGGANAILDALIEAVGDDGTVLFPTLTRPFVAFNGVMVREIGKPYDRDDPAQVWTGGVPRAVLKRKGVMRSAHATHSVAGFGPLAEQCLTTHQLDDPPTGSSSPWARLAELRGKILYLGCGLEASTFLHWLETKLDLPYLGESVCLVKEGEKSRSIIIPQHLPGHRDFYDHLAGQCRFFRKAVEQGLKISSESLGVGTIQMFEAAELENIGTQLLRDDPALLLCEKNECEFCRNARGALKNI